MTPLSPQTTVEAHSVLDELAQASLPLSTWEQLPDALRDLRIAWRAQDEHATRAALVPLSRAAFEAKVGSRLGPSRGRASVVIPTKSTPALPVVGLVCGAILLFLGWQLGGGLMLAATAGLALLVFAVALAGTRANAEHTAKRQRRPSPVPMEDQRVPAPPELLAAIGALRQAPHSG